MSTKIADQVYNLIISGFGYINRVREIAPKGAQPYLCADVSLMEGVAKNGDHSSIQRTRLSCIVKGRRAQEVLRKHFTNPDGEVESPGKVPVTASMQFGGLQPELFTYKGERAGETGVSLRSSLLKITWMKIGDTIVDLGQADQEAEAGEAPGAAQAVYGATDKATASAPAVESEAPAFAGELQTEYGEQGFVKLDPKHPQFQERKAFLKSQGFRWNGAEKHWDRAAA